MKVLALAPWQIDMKPASANVPRPETGLFIDFLPGALDVRRQQARLDQRIGLLRHVEALRMHAAGHDGKLPDKLSDLLVPVPADPFTGRPFGYSSDESTARLRIHSGRADAKSQDSDIECVVAIRK
jgi:hypothetical protein